MADKPKGGKPASSKEQKSAPAGAMGGAKKSDGKKK
ncbi:hypothetical protein Wenmar_00999 [Wenxinia marina DSM 24838]|uniref:Uncharacterized protein n=1 Tax=Wenxinia marina DSM 24838 TaxID=1123501 RepID=A0A0D0PH09_9RHOB|nr:hypothetical protein Wenmar_00999 [Wenxinia marina DSM 24838]